jgi:hypothetical protein
LRLRILPLGNRLVRVQLAVVLRHRIGGAGGQQRLAVGAGGAREVRRIERGQRLALLDVLAEVHQHLVHRARKRRQYVGGAVVVEINHTGGRDGGAVVRRLDSDDVDVLLLVLGQRDVMRLGRVRLRRLAGAASEHEQHRGRQQHPGSQGACPGFEARVRVTHHGHRFARSLSCHQPPPSAW